jgi:hypothetical protein
VQLLLTGISTGQEDRLMITALPLWLLCYPLTWVNIHLAHRGTPVE